MDDSKIVEEMNVFIKLLRTDPSLGEDIDDFRRYNAKNFSHIVETFKFFKGTPNFNKEYLMHILMRGSKGQLNPRVFSELIDELNLFESIGDIK